jgi:uncharacterized membrane protein
MSRLVLPHMQVTLHDILQNILGAALLAIPIGFTQEVWGLAKTLPLENVIFLMFMSIIFITAFVYYQYHKNGQAHKKYHFLGRVLTTYCFAFLTVATFLTILQLTHWQLETIESLKLVLIVTFPASLSAAVADTLN